MKYAEFLEWNILQKYLAISHDTYLYFIFMYILYICIYIYTHTHIYGNIWVSPVV